MPLSWNEIKDRALKFSKDWEHTSNEEADAKPFLDAFFEVFGIPRRKIGTFEHRVKKLNEADGYIDLLWKGTILVEMKSRGKNLDKAFTQAKEYAQGLPIHELPKYILVCALSFLVYTFLPGTVWLALTGMIILTLGEMIAFPFMSTYWMSRSTIYNRGQYAGLYTISWSIAQVLGPPLGTSIAQNQGFTVLWLIVGGITLATGIGYYFLPAKKVR
jgi:hypothetical protein